LEAAGWALASTGSPHPLKMRLSRQEMTLVHPAWVIRTHVEPASILL
jgi:hypothetical protein